MNKIFNQIDAARRAASVTGDAPLSRRVFLKATAIAGAGFAVGCGVETTDESGVIEAPLTESFVGPFVKITSDNKVTVIVKNFEMGQGVSTGLPTIVAEELDADWGQVEWAHAPSNGALYGDPSTEAFLGVRLMATGGSNTIFSSYDWMRKAGATARAMLVGAAAAEWGVPASEITVAKGVLSHASGKSASFGELAEAAAEIEPPAEVTLKDPSAFTLIGAQLPRLDSKTKTDGSEQFTIDVDLPGMLNAVIVHPPKFGAKAVAVDKESAQREVGVREVVIISKGVAVVADTYYNAKAAADKLDIEWDFSEAETRSSDDLFAEFREMAGAEGLVARDDGSLSAGFDNAAQVIEASYEFPFLNHAQIEPLNTVIQLTDEKCEIWTGAQSPTGIQLGVNAATGLGMEKVIVHSLCAGGSFGRRSTLGNDYVQDALEIAMGLEKEAGAPIKLQWDRETDMRAGYYRPMGVIRMRGALDEEGNVIGWEQRNVIPSIFIGTIGAPIYVKDGVDHSVVEGADINPYEIPNLRLEVAYPETKVPISWWRSVGHTLNGYAMEAFIDDLALAGGRDVVELRRQLLANHPRHLGALDKAVEMAGPAPVGPGKGRGVAMHESFRSYVAEVVDVTLNDDGSYKVDKVTCAVDCGVAINPDVIKAQMEGSIAMGLGAIMREEITITQGAVDQSNFYDYFPMRMSDMPDIDVHIIPSAEHPTGVGEPGLPPVGPALANALRDAGAKPIRNLPIGAQVAV